MNIQSILVSQPQPENNKNPYLSLAEKYGLKVDFRPFIHIESVSRTEFRNQKIDFSDFTAVILTSKIAVDYYFKMAEETRFDVPREMKYFCMSEAVAYYLQKYVTFRKRKIFHGKQTIDDLMDAVKKHKKEHFLLPCSDILRENIPEALEKAKINYKKVILYRTVASDLSDLSDVKYSILVFFSPTDIDSLFKNFPDFKQNDTIIAAFGPTTANAIVENNLRLDIHAPQPHFPSMSTAIEQYIKDIKKKKK